MKTEYYVEYKSICVYGGEYTYTSIYVNGNDTQETINSYLLGRELDEGKELLFILYLSV